uniref:Guanylate cyclase n=1 Tax=Strigamia maritima TaxID=126957 RepID=T1JDE4_STRMM
MKHPNLVRFIGACLTSPNVCLLLEPIPKGNLFEILQTDVYNIGWNFKFSILRDIAHGMDYIDKSNLQSHGHLTSKNCLIDNRWTCKVSGFGVPMFRKKIYNVEESMLWSAPELLRTCATPNELGNGTKAGDIYSFGIIMSETCTHDSPFDFELQILSIEELIRLLKNFYDPGVRGIKKLLDTNNYDTSKPIRPALMQSRMPELYSEKRGIENLITITTDEDPALRPNFQDVIGNLNKIHPLKGELIENLIFMLEKYTNHLQDIFNEKVQEVELEKSKTEMLLKRLLPPVIAEKMTQHMDILPELHRNVTIFFSDIVGFTTIAKESKPMEVVELLNDLYTTFDNIIEMFDAYKLETIGDAYCVASGVPTRVVDHYEQIATMALYILSAVTNFPIRHMPSVKLQIRIGIHSGSCVAGIVGVKMPRYCIFGEDVTIASFMESHGAPNTIQMSEATASLLDKIELYYFVFKTILNIKFVGDINCYWLYGKETLKIDLPSLSNHPSQYTRTDSLISQIARSTVKKLSARNRLTAESIAENVSGVKSTEKSLSERKSIEESISERDNIEERVSSKSNEIVDSASSLLSDRSASSLENDEPPEEGNKV